MKKQLPKPGDVLSVALGDGIAYLQYLGKHKQYGDAVLVSRRFEQAQAAISPLTFAGAYIAFYPVSAAARQDLVQIVGNMPARRVPSRIRRAGERVGRTIKSWVIEGGLLGLLGKKVKTTLSESELQLPMGQIWDHKFLVTRINEGFHPSKEGAGSLSDDKTEIDAFAEVPDVETAHPITHYLYLPTRSHAESIARKLDAHGFDTEVRMGADGTNWLALAKQRAVSSEENIDAVRALMEALADEAGGEYDGWETAVSDR